MHTRKKRIDHHIYSLFLLLINYLRSRNISYFRDHKNQIPGNRSQLSSEQVINVSNTITIHSNSLTLTFEWLIDLFKLIHIIWLINVLIDGLFSCLCRREDNGRQCLYNQDSEPKIVFDTFPYILQTFKAYGDFKYLNIIPDVPRKPFATIDCDTTHLSFFTQSALPNAFRGTACNNGH